MRQVIDPVVKTAADLTAASKRIIEDGVKFFRGSLGKIPLFSSVIARNSDEVIERDETHYYLVPYRLSECGYALYTERVLPHGTGPENDLVKARVFHLPAKGTLSVMEALLSAQLKDKHRQQINDDTPLANRLDLIAEEIDKQSNIVTGGLILIGGAVALANPLLGVGIAAKALLPTLGSKLSKHGINHVTDWLRDKKMKSSDIEAAAQAAKEIKRLKPEISMNETLALLEESLATPDESHDPSIPFSDQLKTPEHALKAIQTSVAILCVYQDCLDREQTYTEACLHHADVSWLKSLQELTQSAQS